MSCTIEKTPFKWAKGRGGRGPESCLPRVRPVNSGLVSASGIRVYKTVRWVSQGTEAGWPVPMPSSRRDQVARGSGCAHRLSPKLCNPGITSVWV